MPITTKEPLTRISQAEFAEIAYEVTNKAFAIRKELGPLFDEFVYKRALLQCFPNALSECRIDVAFEDFHKAYFIDFILKPGAIFELKATRTLTDRHRSQLLHYLLLTEMNHGKLINFSPQKVEHTFINTYLTHADRIAFAVNESNWHPTAGFNQDHQTRILNMLSDWGSCLNLELYQEAIIHMTRGKNQALREVHVFQNDKCIAHQVMPLCDEETILHVTTLPNKASNYTNKLTRMLHATKRKHAQWINISRKTITFQTLTNKTK